MEMVDVLFIAADRHHASYEYGEMLCSGKYPCIFCSAIAKALTEAEPRPFVMMPRDWTFLLYGFWLGLIVLIGALILLGWFKGGL